MATDASPLDKLLGLTEGHFADGKSTLVAPAKLSRTTSAFSDADGGELHIGLKEKTKGVFVWDAFANPEAASAHLQVFEELFPLGADRSYAFPSQAAEVPGLKGNKAAWQPTQKGRRRVRGNA